MKISFIGGTGYIGLVTGLGMANHHHQVICADIDKNKIDGLNQGVLPIYEEGLQELYDCAIKKQSVVFTDCIKTAVTESDIVFVTVGTPENKYGDSDLSQLMKALKSIGNYLTEDKVIVIKSTVPVGTCQMAEKYLRQNMKNLSTTIHMVSNPEFLREGSAVHDFMYPERIVIGTENQIAALKMKELYSCFDAPMIFTDLRTSEMIKYACNSYLASRISFINEIAEICEKVNADINSVITGMKLDKRIGSHYLSPGPGFGGPCLSKDLKSLINFGQRAYANVNFLKSVLERNETQIKNIVHHIKTEMSRVNGKKIAVLGLAFKAGTDDTRNSPAISLIESLSDLPATITVYDPLVKALPGHGDLPLSFASSMEEAVINADCVVIMTDWGEFKMIQLEYLLPLVSTPVLIDTRNIFSAKDAVNAGFRYISPGVSGDPLSHGIVEECLENIG